MPQRAAARCEQAFDLGTVGARPKCRQAAGPVQLEKLAAWPDGIPVLSIAGDVDALVEPYGCPTDEAYLGAYPALMESTGTWLRRGFWYAEVDGLLLNRSFNRSRYLLGFQEGDRKQNPIFVGSPVQHGAGQRRQTDNDFGVDS